MARFSEICRPPVDVIGLSRYELCFSVWPNSITVKWNLRMASIPSGKRNWKCPECGAEVLLSMTQLDPIACETCLGKMKGRSSSDRTVTESSPGPLGIWQSLPESTKIAIAAIAFIIGLLIGLAAGYAAGKAAAPQSTTSIRVETETPKEIEEERPEPPGPGYKWVRGREKNGKRGPGHWAKDPFYKGDETASPKKKS